MLIRFSYRSFQSQACCLHIGHNELENLHKKKQFGMKVWDTNILFWRICICEGIWSQSTGVRGRNSERHNGNQLMLCSVFVVRNAYRSNPANQVYAHSFFKNIIFIRTFVSGRHFFTAWCNESFVFMEYVGKHTCLSPLSGIRTVLQKTEIDFAKHAFTSRTPGSLYWFDIGITAFISKIYTVLKAWKKLKMCMHL
jgi:hypothetical protein